MRGQAWKGIPAGSADRDREERSRYVAAISPERRRARCFRDASRPREHEPRAKVPFVRTDPR